MHNKYRVWYDNWDAQVDPVSQEEAIDDIESELRMCSRAMLVTRGDLTHQETIDAANNLVELIKQSRKDY